MNIKTYDLTSLNSIIDLIDTSEPFSFGVDGDQVAVNPLVYLIIEEIFSLLNERKEILSIKFFKDLNDALAYEWHTDDSTPGEEEISLTAILYLNGCEGSKIEFRSKIICPNPYDLILIPRNVSHKAHGNFHKNFLKFTFK